MSFKSLDEYKIGWWKKGNQKRLCHGFRFTGVVPFVYYQTPTQIKNKKYTAVNPVADKWFPKAEYIGKEEEVE